MAKSKELRITIYLECTDCVRNDGRINRGVSRYITQKNRRNTPIRLELIKFCCYCGKHTIHKEVKKREVSKKFMGLGYE